MIPNVFTIAAGKPFAETLARGVIEMAGMEPLALADATILLPTRRAVRTMGETFAKLSGGAALLPQLKPLGDVDEDDILLDPASENLALPPSMTPVRRRLLLAALVQRWDRARHGGHGQLTFAHAALLARALGQFLDEAETQGADLSKLESLAPDALARHWAEVRDFLVFLRDRWPILLDAEGAIEPAARRNLLLNALAERYAAMSFAGPVIAAGTTGSIPATAGLLAVIAKLPNGFVVLPGLDCSLDEESWNALDPGHPQFGMKELIERIGIARRDVRDWRAGPIPLSPRNALLRETLRPAPTTDAWRAIADAGDETPLSAAQGERADSVAASTGTIAQGLEGISLVEAAHPGEEALAIALILREALETKGQTAALVTPDRNLARRVAAELGRWNIAIDDSAGRPLAHTPPGAFLLLLVDAVAEEFAPVPLLALLKHPLAACGMERTEFLRAVRELDCRCLRGPRPDPGLAGAAQAISRAQASEKLSRWFQNVTERLEPLCAAFAPEEIAIADLVEAHAKVAEALAATDTRSGEALLWQGEDGTAAAQLLAALGIETDGIPLIEPSSYASLIRTLFEERAVRPTYGRHPRLAILGPLEARLQSFDVIVLGGLNEGTWPAAAAADPWLSRPMREKLGFASPERAIGLAAHDFATLAAGRRVYLTRALKAEGTPTVASRWLQRLTQLTAGLDLRKKLASAKPYAALAARLEHPRRYAPESRPAPTPPVNARPRRLSVTEIETWLRDPYAIYAKHILKLRPLDPLDAAVGPLERGAAIHRILELFLKEWTDASFLHADERLMAIADKVFRDARIPLAALALWRPRFVKAAHWFVDLERERRPAIARSFVEIGGVRRFESPAGDFVLYGRADRIDVLKAGGAAVLDYKTGNPPSSGQVKHLLAPQLPLEGAILAEGGFGEIGKLAPQELLYIQFGGGAEPGKVSNISGAAELALEAADRLSERIAAFDREETPYLPRVMPFRADIQGEYDHLSRVREWSLSGWREDSE